MRLVKPDMATLPGYRDALLRGWSADTVRGQAAASEELQRIDASPLAFLAFIEDPLALSGAITLPDGTVRQRLPNIRRWMWDGEFCGSIGLRWQRGTAQLPSTVLGHIGFTVVPWKRGAGYAAQALAAILPEARLRGLLHVEITTDPDNIASQKTITRCGGQLVARFMKGAAFGGTEGLRYRIML